MTVRASNGDVATTGASVSYSGSSKRTTVAPSDCHLGDHAVHHRVDLAMPLRLPEQVRHDADARALERVRAQQMRVALRDASRPNAVIGSAGVVAGHHVEQQRRVRHGARDRADLVLRLAVRDDAAAADEPARRADADEVVRGCGRADRLAGVAARAENGEVGGEGRAGAAARTARRAREVVGIQRLTAEAAERHAAARELLTGSPWRGSARRPCASSRR